MGDDRHTDAAAVLVPDAGDDTLRDRLVEIQLKHRIECTGVGEVTCAACRHLEWMSWPIYYQHMTDALLPVIREHTAGLALAVERARAHIISASTVSGVVGLVRVNDLLAALDGTEADRG